MEKRMFAIYDPDAEFVFRFMEFAKSRSYVNMDIRAFTSEEHLLTLAEKKRPELLLVSSSVLSEEVRKLPVRTMVILLEDQEWQTEGLPGVYKYQAPEELLRKVLGFCETKEKAVTVSERRREMEIIGIYSPVGRTRKTTFALTMGQILAKNRSVLYLNLETFAGFEQLFSEQYERTLSDLLYFIRQNQTDLHNKLNSITRSIQNMDYVPPVYCPEDLQGVKPEEWLELFRRLAEQTGYEILILDLGEAVQGLTDILAACSKIYMPVRMDPMSQAKLEQFIWVLGELQGEDVGRRIRKLKLPFCQNNKSGKEFFSSLVWSELGDLIRKELAEEGKL